ncbi:MAG: hypothetical protein H6588_04220 [Flavobacteriales bacterium]|nr:hypothetical protein [Flavobacteriales bacterium]
MVVWKSNWDGAESEISYLWGLLLLAHTGVMMKQQIIGKELITFWAIKVNFLLGLGVLIKVSFHRLFLPFY